VSARRLDPELTQMLGVVRELVRHELEPLDGALDRSGELPRDLLRQVGALGLMGLLVPTAYGGLGLNLDAFCWIAEEMARAPAVIADLFTVTNTVGALPLLADGTEDQKRAWLPRVAGGESLVAFCLTEPNAGSDAAAIQTHAKVLPNGQGYAISGIKHFITAGAVADLYIVFARVPHNRRDGARAGARREISAFLVERGTPGLRVARMNETMGPKPDLLAELHFDECRVGPDQVLGRVGDGFGVATRNLAVGRLAVAAAAVGSAQKLLEMATAYARSRIQFGRPIAANQAIQFMLADVAVEVQAARALLHEVASRYDAGERDVAEAAKAKLFASEMVGRAADIALQIHGGMGYMAESAVQRLYRKVRASRIYEGSSEIMRMVIARDLLDEPRD
jgi:acyl-CoA dehydrogenase